MMMQCVVAFVSLVSGAVATANVRGSALQLMQVPMDQVRSRIQSANAAVVQSAVRGGGESGYEAMRSQVDSARTVPAIPSVTAATTKANKMFEAMHTKDSVCARDWEGCPDGWALSFDSCIAPQSYKGPCSNVLHLGGGLDKQKFADDCKAPWPCAGECSSGHDYGISNCPVGWIDQPGEYCEHVGAIATEKCNSKYDFASISTEMKQSLAIACGHQWPCLMQCEPDYLAACPHGWSLDAAGVRCVAPMTYAGECAYAADLRMFTREEKAAFARTCDAPFPCSGIEVVATGRDAAALVRHGAIDATGAIQ